MVWFVLLAALGARAGEPTAPLEDSKQELKALQKEQSTNGVEAPAGKLHDVMPRLQAPDSPALPVEPPVPQKSETQLNREARENWLLDGMDRLEKNPKGKARNPKDESTKSKGEQADPNDPNYLLNLYGEQQKNAAAKAAAKTPAAGRKDPLTPFLQDWLANSPVRGKFFDEYMRQRTTTDGSTGATARGQLESGASASFAGIDPDSAGVRHGPDDTAPVAANPYLQSLDLSALHEKSSHDSQTAAAAGFRPAANPPTAALVDPGLPARPPDRKPPPPLADDNKYFPQLKKF